MDFQEDMWNVEAGNDQHGRFVWIDRIRNGRTTAWKLYRMPDGRWRYFKVLFSRENLGLNFTAEREKSYNGDACPCHGRGVKLTDSKLDRTLLYLAESA